MTADLPWRNLLARWARACAAPVAALAAAAVIWAIWQRFGGMISLISAVDWFRGPSQEAGRLPPWSTWGGWPWLPLLLAVPAVASATWFRWWPGFGLMCGLGAGLIAGAFELATSIQAVALGSVLAGAVTLLPASNAAYAWDLRTVGLARPICSSVAVAALLQVIAPNLLELRAETLLGLALALGVLGLAGMGAALVDRPTAQADWLRPILVFAGCGLVFAGMTELLIRILYSARPYIPFGGDSALIGGLLAAMLARIVPFTKNLFIRLIALTVLLQIMFFVFEHDGMLKFSIGGSQLEVSSIILPLRMLVLCANFPFVSKRYFLTCFIFMFLLKFSITFSLLASDISKSVVPQSSAVGFVAEYAAVILMTRPKPQTRQLWTWAALRPWFASLPLLACSLHFFFGNALFILPWLAIPVAAWLVQRYGAAALTPIAVMLAPMLVGFSTGWFGTAGNPGLFLTALLTARLVHDAALRESVMAAAAPLATGHVWLLLFTLPCVVAISVFAGITVGTWLWTLMLALLVLIGLSRVPLAPLRRPVFLAFGFGTAFLMVRTAVGINPLTPTINLGFAFQTPADLLAVALALWGTRALRTEMQSDPKEIQTRNLRGMALLLFLAAIILEPVRLSLLRTQLDLVGHASVLLLSLALGMLPHPQHGKRDWVTTGTLVLLYAVPLLLLAIALPRGMDLWVVTITPNNILGTVCGAAETAAFTVFGRRLGPYFSQQRVGRAATPPPSSRQFAALLGAVREDARRIAVITAVAIMIGTLIVPLLGQDKNNAATAPQESGTSGASSSKF